jgi:hypothetical protein
MGGTEVSLFALLYTDGKFPSPWHFWFFVLAVHSGLAVLLVKNRIKNTCAEDFDPKLRELVYEKYMRWMKEDVAGAKKGTIGSVVFGLITCFFWWKAGQQVCFFKVGRHLCDWAIVILPVFPSFLLIYATQKATRQLQELDGIVSQAQPGPVE